MDNTMFSVSSATPIASPLVKLQPVRQPHGHHPGPPVLTVEHSGRPVPEGVSVPLRLLHRRPEVKAFCALHLDMYAGEAHQIRDIPEGQGPAPDHIVPVGLKNGGKLTLTVRSFTLR